MRYIPDDVKSKDMSTRTIDSLLVNVLRAISTQSLFGFLDFDVFGD